MVKMTFDDFRASGTPGNKSKYFFNKQLFFKYCSSNGCYSFVTGIQKNGIVHLCLPIILQHAIFNFRQTMVQGLQDIDKLKSQMQDIPVHLDVFE